MRDPTPSQFTAILRRSASSPDAAFAELFPIVYDQLRRIAGEFLVSERTDHTLQPTALVHEAFLKLVDQSEARWEERAQFLGIAAQAMRRILVDHARTRRRRKRGGDAQAVQLDEAVAIFEERAVDLIALDEALTKLSNLDERKAKLVELRFYAGLPPREAAEVMGIPLRTAERDWAMARSWLRSRLAEAEPDAGD